MNGSRWLPAYTGFNQLQQLRNEMNRLFGRGGTDGGSGFEQTGVFPPLNVWEDGDKLFVEAELPGLELKDMEMYVTNGNQLTIKGERKVSAPDKGVWHRQERATGTFVRSLTLPYNVDAEKVDAKFENGVLLVTLPRHESAKPRKITVKGE
jgi:HSP20 family protein